jgi:hypothetical protein
LPARASSTTCLLGSDLVSVTVSAVAGLLLPARTETLSIPQTHLCITRTRERNKRPGSRREPGIERRQRYLPSSPARLRPHPRPTSGLQKAGCIARTVQIEPEQNLSALGTSEPVTHAPEAMPGRRLTLAFRRRLPRNARNRSDGELRQLTTVMSRYYRALSTRLSVALSGLTESRQSQCPVVLLARSGVSGHARMPRKQNRAVAQAHAPTFVRGQSSPRPATASASVRSA